MRRDEEDGVCKIVSSAHECDCGNIGFYKIFVSSENRIGGKIMKIIRIKQLYLVLAILIISGCLFDKDDNSSKQNIEPTEPPLAPSGLTTDVSVPYAITLNWNDNADTEKGYVLGYNIKLPPNTTQWTLSDLDHPAYRFELFAYNDVGISSTVWSEWIKVTWEYPHIYKINIINVENNVTTDYQTQNGFVYVTEDSVAISFTYIFGGKKFVVMENSKRPAPNLNLQREDAWFSKQHPLGNVLPKNLGSPSNKVSFWATRVESMEDITD